MAASHSTAQILAVFHSIYKLIYHFLFYIIIHTKNISFCIHTFILSAIFCSYFNMKISLPQHKICNTATVWNMWNTVCQSVETSKPQNLTLVIHLQNSAATASSQPSGSITATTAWCTGHQQSTIAPVYLSAPLTHDKLLVSGFRVISSES